MNLDYQIQDKFLDKFYSTKFAADFYLTGGTALTRFYYDHRVSVDLDLFTNNQKIDFSQVNLAVLKILDHLKLKVTKQVITDTFLQYICEHKKKLLIKIDLVKDIPRHFGEIKTQGKIRVDSLENIGSNKVLAIFGRTDGKDFIDLYVLLRKTKLKFAYLYSLAKQKDLGLTEFYLVNAIQNIENIRNWPPLKMKLESKKVVKFYQDLAKSLLRKIKPKS